MKRFLLVGLFLCIGGLAFAQMGYTFLVEKQSATKEVNVSVFQALTAVPLTDSDTLNHATLSNDISYLFSSLHGNTSDLIILTPDTLSSETRNEAITANEISSCFTFTNEQTNIWEGALTLIKHYSL
jgi:hypothetical protein